MTSLSKQGSTMLSNFLTLVVGNEHSLAESEFVGAWQVQDSEGHPFEIALFGLGTAEADRAGEGMKGTWTTEGSGDAAMAVITWDTGWTTKIAKTGEGTYTKIAYGPNAATPANTSTARRSSRNIE